MKNLSLAKRTFIGYGVAGIILIVFSIMGINAQRTIAEKNNHRRQSDCRIGWYCPSGR